MHNSIEYKGLTWVDVVEPTEVDVSFLKNKFNLHPVTLKNIVPSVIHPTFDSFENYISMTLHYPRNEKGGNVKIHEIDIIVGKNYFITNHYLPLKPINSVWDQCAASEIQREEFMGEGSVGLTLSILNKFLKRILEKTDKIGEEIALIEKEIFNEEGSLMIRKISYLKRKIISFWRAVEPQNEIFSYLEPNGAKFFGEEYKHYFGDLYNIYQTINGNLRAYKETAESLEKTSNNIINIERTDVMKILTIFSVVLMPLTLLASIWGMNTNVLPFMESKFDFWLIMGLMVIVLVSMLTYFKIKKWL
jgi:magnesium transporter